MADRLDLHAFQTLVNAEIGAWQALGLAVEFGLGKQTAKPAATLSVEGVERLGQLTVWVSGETELEVGERSSGDVFMRSEEGVTPARLAVIAEELVRRVSRAGQLSHPMPWTARANALVLYSPEGRWRFAVYNEVGVMDGALDLPVDATVGDAQAALLARVQEDTGLRYEANWTQDGKGWWTAELRVAS